MAGATSQHGVVRRQEATVNSSFVEDDVTEREAAACASTAVTDGSDVATAADSVPVPVHVMKIHTVTTDCSPSTTTSSSVSDSHSDCGTAVSDVVATDQCRGASDARRPDDVPVWMCPVTVSETTMTPVNQCTSDSTRQTTAASDVMTHVLPTYSVSAGHCLPFVRHQTSTSSSVRRRRKLCAECCLHCVVMTTSLRFLLVAVVLIGTGCVATGIGLAALNVSAGNNYFTLSVIFVGLGVVLVVMVGIAWRFAEPGYEPCHSLINNSTSSSAQPVVNRRCLQFCRHNNQWHGGTLYAEFHYETPPPAYTSLDHRQHEVVAQTTTTTTTSLTAAAATDAECGSVTQSNPPSYRSHVSRSSRRAITSHSSAVDSDVISPPDYGTSIAMSF